MKLLLPFFIATCCAHSLWAQLIEDTPLSPRNANYQISVRLDASEKKLYGNERLTWINTSSDTIPTLQFHLYLNAFKNTKSTFIKESGGQLRNAKMDKMDDANWGWVDVLSMRTARGEELEDRKFIQPDDDNQDDRTVMEVVLPQPVMGGDTVVIDIEFVSKLPKIFARTGFGKDDYYLVAQWFPKIGVWEPKGMRYSTKGSWNCHQFHANSEFYADFGVYDVEITAPSTFVVGATGRLQKEFTTSDTTKTYQYKALDVIDFAWTASPRYLDIQDKWNDVDIRLLIMPEHEAMTERYLRSTRQALEYFDNNLGKYPYNTLTVIDPPMHSMGAGGMEYPTFITGGSMYNMPEGVRMVELVTVHEFGHQYFMGMLASNEFEEPWLDEGFNTYFEDKTMDHYYGNGSAIDFIGVTIGDTEMSRNGYVGMRNPKIAPNFRASWEYRHGGYGSLTYSKTGTWMRTLEGLIGEETMQKVMKTYFKRWSFKHPCATDFIAIVNEMVREDHGTRFGEDMQWYFDQVLYGTETCDYAVASLRVRKVKSPQGVFDEGQEPKEPTEEDEDKADLFTSRVVVNRLDEMVLPQQVKITFSDGQEVIESWDGKDRSYGWEYTKESKVSKVQIDPERLNLMDTNLINNSMSVEKEGSFIGKYQAKVMMAFQSLLYLLTSFM